MGAHVYHEELPGFDFRQILYDGCEECESRAQSRNLGIAYLDRHNSARAMLRAIAWNGGADVGRISKAETPMLDVMWAIHCQFQGLEIP